MNPFEQAQFLDTVHRNIPVQEHLEILFSGTTIGTQPFLPLYREALKTSGTEVGLWKSFRRAQRALTLLRYFERSLPAGGHWIECGVLQGFSALLLATVARIHDPGFAGEKLHLVDSFEGLSKPTREDALGARKSATGAQELIFSAPAGHFATPMTHVQKVLRAFPAVEIHKGWIPGILRSLPERSWSFVHIDVDLYEPTKTSLEYFFPRLTPGGIVVNDDFNSPLFPGAGLAWHEFFSARKLSYVVLDTGQSIYVNTPP